MQLSKNTVANKGFKRNVQTKEVIFNASLPESGHQHGTHDTGKKNEVDRAFESERNVGNRLLEFFVVFKFFLVEPSIQKEINDQKKSHGKAGHFPKMSSGPEEGHAAQETQEQGRIAERS